MKTRARLPSDVWLGVATYCSVDKLLEFETTCRAFRDLARGKSMDSVWRQRLRMAEPALATVLLDQPPRARHYDRIDGRHIDGNGEVVAHAELSGRDFCRLYESRWRYKATDMRTPDALGVAPWDGGEDIPWNEPRVIIVVDDVAGEVAWNGYNGYGVHEQDLSLTWVPNESAAQREYDYDEICRDVMTSCFLVDNQKIVELWRECREPQDVDCVDVGTLLTYQHGRIEIFAFNRDRVPQDRFHDFAHYHEAFASYHDSNLDSDTYSDIGDGSHGERYHGDCNLCTMLGYLRFRRVSNEDDSRYRLFDASISIAIHEYDSVTSLSGLASLLKRMLAPGSSLVRLSPHSASREPPSHWLGTA